MEAAVATKFVKWEVPTLESLHECKVYRLRMKVNNGEVLNREEKNWITEKVNGNTYFKSAIPLQGWRFDFSDILRTFLVSQYGQWREYKVMDKTALRKILYGRIDRIVELDKRHPKWTAQSIGLAVFAFLLRCFLWIVNILWYIIREIVCGVFRMVINVMVFIIFLIAIFGFLLWLLTL